MISSTATNVLLHLAALTTFTVLRGLGLGHVLVQHRLSIALGSGLTVVGSCFVPLSSTQHHLWLVCLPSQLLYLGSLVERDPSGQGPLVAAMGGASAVVLVCGLQRMACATPPGVWWVGALAALATGAGCTSGPLQPLLCLHLCSLLVVQWLGVGVQWVIPLLGAGSLVVTKVRALEELSLWQQ